MSDLINAKEAALLLGRSISFIRKEKDDGHLPYTQLGSRYMFEKKDVLNLIKKVNPKNVNEDITLE